MILPLYALEFGHGEAMAASVLAARGLGNMLGDLPAGAATARWGDRPVMQIGIAMMLLSTVLAGTVAHATMLLICATGIGFAMATWLLARLALVGDMVASQWRGQALSTMAGLKGWPLHRTRFRWLLDRTVRLQPDLFYLSNRHRNNARIRQPERTDKRNAPCLQFPKESPPEAQHTEPQAHAIPVC